MALCPLSLPGQLGAVPRLYPSGMVRPEGVRQGRLGSCYFHSVIAALAHSNPQMLQKMIQENSDGTYVVRFVDGKKETAYPEDLRYTRESGYDLSEGLWVAVLFRAYAQKVLRESLAEAIDKSDLFPLVKKYAEDFVVSNDPLLLAYDRAIRTQVDQSGNIDRTKLEAKLKEQMMTVAVSDKVKDTLVRMLESGRFFDSMAETIRQNGELFGAYRAVGQGGLAERAMQALAGSVQFRMNESEAEAASALTQAFEARLPVAACTGGSRFFERLAAGQPLPAEAKDWYVNAHCYTVLGFDAAGGTVTLRNPWARHPDPDGILRVPLSTFVPAFYGVVSSGR